MRKPFCFGLQFGKLQSERVQSPARQSGLAVGQKQRQQAETPSFFSIYVLIASSLCDGVVLISKESQMAFSRETLILQFYKLLAHAF